MTVLSEQDSMKTLAPEVRFRTALEALLAGRTQPCMHYQPIVDLRRGVVAGYEALIRFPSPPTFPPDYWFKSAQLRGKRLALEHMAARLALESRGLLPSDTFLSINVGPTYLLTDEFLSLMREAQSLERVIVEITEGDLIEDYPAVRRRLEHVRALGGSVAVDDTGSGYASLKHVMELRPQFVKLDRFFVQGCHHDPVKSELIHMIGEAADRLDAWLIAEGIETSGELNEVLRRNVGLGQGYFLGRPQAELLNAASEESLHVIRFRQRGAGSAGLWHLLESAQQFATVAEATRAVTAHGHSVSAAVLDQYDRPHILVEHHPVLGVRELPALMRVAVSSGIHEVLRRAISRPLAHRFDPVAVTGECGEFVGVLRIDHLVGGVLSHTPTDNGN